jgi:nucleoside-diphosphate-sugar epimerase
MKVLVTGGSGVLGRALISKLLEQGREVIVYDLKPPPQVHPKLVFIEGDVRDKQKVTKACKGCEIVFHLAAKMPQARLSEEGFYDINVRGTLNVADACVKNKVRRLVFASTTEIYGPQEISTPLDEEAPKLFTGPYSRNKWECEKRLLEYWKKYSPFFGWSEWVYLSQSLPLIIHFRLCPPATVQMLSFWPLRDRRQ